MQNKTEFFSFLNHYLSKIRILQFIHFQLLRITVMPNKIQRYPYVVFMD